MSEELQWLIYIAVGILLYIFIWRKKIIDSISIIILYIGTGFFSQGMANVGGAIIAFSIIVSFIQYYISNKKKN